MFLSAHHQYFIVPKFLKKFSKDVVIPLLLILVKGYWSKLQLRLMSLSYKITDQINHSSQKAQN